MTWFNANLSNSGGGGGIIFDTYLYLNDETIDTPVTLNSNHRIYIDFQLDNFVSQLQIVGNTAGNTSNFYCGLWNGAGPNRFYVRTSNGEHYQVLSDYTVRHTLDVNNGKVYVDNIEWYDGTSNTNSNVKYTIGYRGAEHRMIGKIYRFFIYDIVNEEYLIDYMPAHVEDVYGMYDIVNRKFYPKQSR